MELNKEPSRGTKIVGINVDSVSTATDANHCSSTGCVVIPPRYAAPVTMTSAENIGTSERPNKVS